MKRRIVALIPTLFLFVMACSGGDKEPPPPINQTSPEVTQEMMEADRKLREALENFRKGMTDPSKDKQNWEQLVVATLLWKSAPQKDGSLAINNPYYRDVYLPKLFQGFANQTVNQYGINQQNQGLLMQRYMSGFQNEFLPRLSGQISPSQLGQIQSVIGRF